MWKLLAFGAAWLALVASSHADEVRSPDGSVWYFGEGSAYGADGRRSSDAKFIARYDPTYVEPSWAPKTLYKHPGAETMAEAFAAQIKKAGKPLLNLGECGSITGPFAIYGDDGWVVFSVMPGETIGPLSSCK